MKLTFNFQTLILLTLTVVLTVATAVWGAVVYQSIYDIILGGFDRKLIALSNGAAEFTDGDGHAAYQRPREIQALTVGPEGRLLGFDRSRGEVVEIDPADGGALPAAAFALPPLRSLAFDPQSGRLAALAEDGEAVALAEALAPHQGLDHAHHFRAFFVHGAGVEVADFLVLVGLVGHGGFFQFFGALALTWQALAAMVFDAISVRTTRRCPAW